MKRVIVFYLKEKAYLNRLDKANNAVPTGMT
jgi:hypothetical protein